MSQLPLRTEWRTGTDLAPRSVVESTVDIAIPYQVKPPAVPISTRGMAHVRKDGSVGFDLRDDSELYVGVYGFGAGEFADDRYGLTVRDEMLAANMGVEGGSINHYQKQPGGFAEWFEMLRQKRIADGEALKRWPGPWSATDDDFLGPDALVELMQESNWELYVYWWCLWRNQITTQQPRFVIYKDEVNLAFGGDPEDASQVLLSKLVPYGGIKRVIDVLRSASGCPVAPGMFGVGNEVPVGYSKWLDPQYADFVAQYHQPNNIPAPWSGQTLRQAAETLKWAAKHRDPSRPLCLNYGLIVDYWIMQEDGEWKKTIPATDPKSIAGQLWVNAALGATVQRGYALAAHDLVILDNVPRNSSFRAAPAEANPHLRMAGPPPPVYRSAKPPEAMKNLRMGSIPPGSEYQKAVAPGDPEYYALLSSAKLINENQDLLLGTEQPVPDAGPDFLCGHRLSPKGRIWWAVNLSETWRAVHAAPLWPGTLMDSQGKRTAVDGPEPIPPNGVLILTARTQ